MKRVFGERFSARWRAQTSKATRAVSPGFFSDRLQHPVSENTENLGRAKRISSHTQRVDRVLCLGLSLVETMPATNHERFTTETSRGKFGGHAFSALPPFSTWSPLLEVEKIGGRNSPLFYFVQETGLSTSTGSLPQGEVVYVHTSWENKCSCVLPFRV